MGDIREASSQAEMLALGCKVGDMCERLDNLKMYVLNALPASTLGNWSETYEYKLGPMSHSRYLGQWVTAWGHIASFGPKRSTQLDETSSCYYNADENIVQDAEGIGDEITITGNFKGTMAQINKFVMKMFALQNGEQLDNDYLLYVASGCFFYCDSSDSPYAGNGTATGIPVKVAGFEPTFDLESTDTIKWTLTLKVGLGA